MIQKKADTHNTYRYPTSVCVAAGMSDLLSAVSHVGVLRNMDRESIGRKHGHDVPPDFGEAVCRC